MPKAAAYLGYVLWIGGDFMSGRFFTAPLFVAAGVIVRYAPLGSPVFGLPAIAAVAALGLTAPRPTIHSDGRYHHPHIPDHGIADERGVYYRTTGLLRIGRAWTPPDVGLDAKYTFAIERGRRAITSDFIGLQGYLAGRSIHIIDLLALADPLLARLPAERPWRVGHYPRALPDGYFQSVNTGGNEIRDADLARYYDAIRVLTRDPLLSTTRLMAILRMNTGGLDAARDAYVARMGTSTAR